MATLQLLKSSSDQFKPAYQSDLDSFKKIKIGSLVHADIKQPRNPLFHRKFFAMLNFAFDYWEPEPIKVKGIDQEPEKNFERFRKDILILAGYRKAIVNIKNEVRFEAQSISFASMDDLAFQKVYENVFAVLWRLILKRVKGMTEQDAHNAIDAMLSYD